MSLAAFYEKQGRSEESIELLEEFVNAHPDSVRASLLLTSFYAHHRDTGTLARFLDRSFESPEDDSGSRCGVCGYEAERMRWHCPQCNSFDSFVSKNHVS